PGGPGTMNFLSAHGPVLLQLIGQVTAWTGLGCVLVFLASRRGPRVAAELATLVLGGVVLLTALTVLPWPGWMARPAAPPVVVVTMPAVPRDMSRRTGIDQSGEVHSGGLRPPARLEESEAADVHPSLLPEWGSVLVVLFIVLAAVLACRLALG